MGFKKITIDIIWWSDSGRKIPNDAIAYEQKGDNNIAYLVRIRGEYTDKILEIYNKKGD